MKPTKAKRAKQDRKARGAGADAIAFKAKNYWLFAAGFGSIILGYVLLSTGSITLAPILLVAGYCALVPLAIFLK
ncbi:MAG: hypothetical protein V2A71_07390 [Candidatus Eisenbacteria bacterium]